MSGIQQIPMIIQQQKYVKSGAKMFVFPEGKTYNISDFITTELSAEN